MPLEKRTTASQLRAVSIGIAALAVAVGVTIMFFQAAGNGKAPVVVSDTTDQFRVGNATAMAKSIAGDGPLLFSDVSGRGQQRPIYVTHQGADPLSGWRAFSAKAKGSPDGCFVQWDAEADRFTQKDGDGESCDDRTFDLNGEGLTPYPVGIVGSGDEATIFVDLGAEGSTTTSTTSTTVAVP